MAFYVLHDDTGIIFRVQYNTFFIKTHCQLYAHNLHNISTEKRIKNNYETFIPYRPSVVQLVLLAERNKNNLLRYYSTGIVNRWSIDSRGSAMSTLGHAESP